jgi:hypothetical protein
MRQPPPVAAGDGRSVVPWSQDLWGQAGMTVQSEVRRV